MQVFIPLSVPSLRGNEKKYLNEAIDSEWVSTAGSFVRRFEVETAQYLGSNDSVACQSGTAGLHLGLQSLGITSKDEVLVPTLTFIAAVNPVRYVGAEPVFMDCDENLCIDPLKISKFIHDNTYFCKNFLINKTTHKRIKALIVVHTFGNMCDMSSIMDIAERYNLLVIEDATEAFGTKFTTGPFAGDYAGTIGDVGIYSFNGNKIITTGGGGLVIAREKSILDKVRYLSTQAKDDDINFIHNEVGYNYRMTNLQAALGVAQLEQLEGFIKAKKRNYLLYKEYMDGINGVRLLPFRLGIRPNYWFYSLELHEKNHVSKDDVIRMLREKNIQSRPIWALIHEQIPYINSQSYRIENAKYYQKRTINIPCSPNLTKESVLYICRTIEEIIRKKV